MNTGEPIQRPRWVGTSVKRKEDLRFITGRGEYVDDRAFARALHVVPVRSPHAHARVLGINGGAAAALPGVIAVLTAQDLQSEIEPVPAPVPEPYRGILNYPLARDTVRYVGEAVAVVVAENPYVAEDGAQLVEVDYAALYPMLDPEAACDAAAPRVHESVPSNIAWRRNFVYGDPDAAFGRADHVISRRLHLHRFTSAPLETRQAVVEYFADSGVYHVFSNIQAPERYRPRIAASLGVDPQSLHFEAPDIGGGFGLKGHVLWLILLCAISRRFNRPAKWVEDRTGHLLASHHSNEILYESQLAVRTDGTILALRVKAIHDEGAYLLREPKGAVNQLRHATSLYRFRDLQMEFLAVLTNKCPTGPNRSYGKVQQTMLVERMIDEAARELGLDAVEVRRLNLVRPEEMPYETPTGAMYDGGDYPAAFRRLDTLFDFAGFREQQRALRAHGKYIGCGVAAGIEASPSNAAMQQLIDPADLSYGESEAGLVRIERDGSVFVALGTVSQGHGHETVVAQIVADELAVTPDEVHVTTGYDSWRDPYTRYSGTNASRFSTMGVGAVVGAARAMRDRLVRIGAHLCGGLPGDMVLSDGRVIQRSTGMPYSFAVLAEVATSERLPSELNGALEQRYVYAAPLGPSSGDGRGNFSLTYAYSVTLVTVEIDAETGRIKLQRIICIDDCGKRMNPMIIDGMVHGAIAHQVGAALFERIQYDASGQLTTATFKDYLTPTAADLPAYEVHHLETPSLVSALGAKGGGEGAGTPLVATLNAVADALAPFGATLVEGHVTPAEVRDFIRRGPRK